MLIIRLAWKKKFTRMAKADDNSTPGNAERDQLQQALRFLAESTPAHDLSSFLRDSLAQIARFYGARWAFVGLFAHQDRNAIKTLALYDNGHFPDNITYTLDNSPCAQVLEGKLELIPAGVREQFPHDLLLKTMAVESYFGVALDAPDGPLGILVVMDQAPMLVSRLSRSVLRSFSVRITAEIQRFQTNARLQQRNDILHAVTRLSSIFYNGCPLDDNIAPAMKLLGQATLADRVFLIRNRQSGNNERVMELVSEWITHDVPHQATAKVLHGLAYTNGLTHWERALKAGRILQHSVPDSTGIMTRLAIEHLVAVPVFVEETWWGFIGFGRPRGTESWSTLEIEAMQTAAEMIGTAIAHDQAIKELNFAASVYENSLEAIMITDTDGRITRVNPAFTQVTGYSAEEIVGRDVSILHSDRHDAAFYEAIEQRLQQQGFWKGEIWSRRKSGEVYPQQTSISISLGCDRKVHHHIVQFTDISEQKRYQEHIQHLALYDPLTDLPNRRLFQERLDQALRESRRKENATALLYIDLDNFKMVNDTFGHATGDKLLLELTGRLRNMIRETDTLARLGGDEFTVILHALPDSPTILSRISEIAVQIIGLIKQPYHIEGHEALLSASVGIALYPKDSKNSNQLILHADRAMYHAKESGKNTYKFYSNAMDIQARKRHLMESRLRSALEKGEFLLHYQPQTDLESGRIIGLEALVRWQYDEQQLLYPADFIPLAEETGVIVDMGYWVLRTACNQLGKWHAQGFKHLAMTVNISPKQLLQTDFVEQVAGILRQAGVPPTCLELDTTEQILRQGALVTRTLTQLKEMGIRITLDDFGSGYSSLAQLRDSPLDAIKIDASFIDDIPNSPDASPLAAAIIALARALKLRVVAEGVESASQLEFLRHQNCDSAQGLMLGESLPADKMQLLLAPGWSPEISQQQL